MKSCEVAEHVTYSGEVSNIFDCFFFSSRRRHTKCALVTGVQTCALPICREYLVDLRKVPRRRRLVAPQREQVGKPLRHMRRVALRAPIGLVAAAQRIVELQKLDDTIPAIAEQRVEALGRSEERRVGKGGVSTGR